MTDLKTLKDLDKVNLDNGNEDYCECCGLPGGAYFTEEVLRSEAVKDFNALEEDYENFPSLLWDSSQAVAIQRYIKWKFNLTEQELQEAEG